MNAPGDQAGSPSPGEPRSPYRYGRPGSMFLRSFIFAGQGAWHAVRTQRNMRVHLAAAAAVIVVGVVLRVGAVQWACLSLAIGLVLTAEIFNTVVEAMIDLHTQQFHPLAKIAKDGAAGAVLVASAAAVGVAIAVFVPRL